MKKNMTDYRSLLILKKTLMNFLRVNNFDITKDSFTSTFTVKKFKNYLQNSKLCKLLDNLKKNYDKLEKKDCENAKNYQVIKKCIQNHLNDYDKLTDFQKHRNNLSSIYENNDGIKILVYFMGETNLNTISNKYLKIVIQLMIYLECTECLIITANEPSNQFKKELSSINMNVPYEDTSKIFRVISYTDNTFIDLTKHAYIPNILNIYRNEKTNVFIKENNLEDINDFPKILVTDPICKFYRCKVNDIIELERDSGLENNLIDKHLAYRHVINV